MSLESKFGAEPTEKRSSNDEVEFEYQATGSKSLIEAAAPDANANPAMANRTVPEREMLRPDETCSAFDVT
jgi:hypothetical protein